MRCESGRLAELARAVERLGQALGVADAARDHAAREVGERGFSDLDRARLACRDSSETRQLEDRVSAWNELLAALKAAAEAEELTALDPAEADAVHGEARAAGELLVAAEAARNEVLARAQEIDRQNQRFAERAADVLAAEAAHDAVVEKTEAVVRLAGLAKGMEGHRRVALTTYVLRQWFEQVVAAANIRLATTSSSRYQLRRVDEGERRNARAGLTLKVIDRYTGEERSPASLSGGETFYTSLALALGLVDVVKAEAGGVDLDTLFIDEGFGSLDGQTLDQVMLVIDELRDRGRAIGVVSHVAELKERIPERLEVRRIDDGSSVVRVVA